MNRIPSIFYRFTLLVYISLLLFKSDNFFDTYIYIITLIAYVPLIYFFTKPNDKFAFFRLLVDYTLITLVLYGKDISYYLNFIIIILPIVNSVNHTGSKTIFPKRFFIIILFTLFILNNFKFDIYWLIPIGCIYLITTVISVKEAILSLSQLMLSTINVYFERTPENGKIYKLFKDVIATLNKKKTFPLSLLPQVTRIGCFRLSDGQMNLLASYPFVKSYVIVDELKLIQELEIKKTSSSNLISFDEVSCHFNEWFYMKGQHTPYIFYFEFEKPLILRNLNHKIIKMSFTPFIRRVAKVLDLEHDLTVRRLDLLSKLKVKSGTLNKLNRFIHFLNNNLSPIKNYFELLQEKGSLLAQDRKATLNKLIDEEEKVAYSTYKIIELKAKKLGDKKNNPAFVSSMISIPLKRVLTIVRAMWLAKGLDQNAIIAQWEDPVYDYRIDISIDDFDYVLDEIMNNCKKYNTGSYFANFHEDDKLRPCITFSNSAKKDRDNIDNLQIIKRQYNQISSNEVLHRASHGMHIIKSFLDQMNLQSFISITDGFFSLTIILTSNRVSK